jgi:hypothetical protein
LELPENLKIPDLWISLLLFTPDNLELYKMNRFLDCIKYQRGRFNIEIVWLDTSLTNYKEIKILLDSFERNTRFTKITYHSFLKTSRKDDEHYIEIGKMLSSGSVVFLANIENVLSPTCFQTNIDLLEKNNLNEERKIIII